jgi:hypothetical protein
MLTRQRETDEYNIQQAMYEGREARRQMFWEANVAEAVGEEEAVAREYVGSIESAILKAEAANALATGRIQEASAIYNGAAKATSLRNQAISTRYQGKVGAQSTRYQGNAGATALRNQSWGQLASSLGSAAMMGSQAFQPQGTATGAPGPVPTGPSYFKAGNPVSPNASMSPAYTPSNLPAPSMFRG